MCMYFPPLVSSLEQEGEKAYVPFLVHVTTSRNTKPLPGSTAKANADMILDERSEEQDHGWHLIILRSACRPMNDVGCDK